MDRTLHAWICILTVIAGMGAAAAIALAAWPFGAGALLVLAYVLSGFGHVAFLVEDVDRSLWRTLAAGALWPVVDLFMVAYVFLPAPRTADPGGESWWGRSGGQS